MASVSHSHVEGAVSVANFLRSLAVFFPNYSLLAKKNVGMLRWIAECCIGGFPPHSNDYVVVHCVVEIKLLRKR